MIAYTRIHVAFIEGLDKRSYLQLIMFHLNLS